MPPTKTLSPKEMARFIGVSQSSIKRWVDAGRIAVTRTAGGHRRIGLEEALRFIREHEMQIQEPEVLGLSDLTVLPAEMPPEALTGERLLAALGADNAVQARGLITGAYISGQALGALFDGPIRDVMTLLGKRWRDEDSATAIYLEHQATQIIIQAIHQIQMLLPPPGPEAPVAIGCTPPNDPYTVPSMMAATVLAEQGYRAINLGTNTPASVLLRAVESHEARVAWIAATSGHDFVDDLHEWQEVITLLQERQVQVILGGQALHRLNIVWPEGVRFIKSMTDLAAYGKRLLP